MSRQGSRTPLGLGLGLGVGGAVVVVLGLGAWAASRVLSLRDVSRALAAPATLLQGRDSGGASERVSTGSERVSSREISEPLAAYRRISRKPLPPAAPAVPAVAPPAIGLTPDVLFARSVPAVVRINVNDGAMKPLGHGSGFFVSGDGLVVTNYHVIDGANYATVECFDGTVLLVDGVVAVSGNSDLVLLKVTPADNTTLPTLPIGPDDPPHVGTTVYAIGHPFGLKNVLSEGLVSSLGDPGQGQHFIQTTAAISPGSSGGPLMTADGVVVGVTTATVREAQNLNFAMPAERVRLLLGQPRADAPASLARTVAEVRAARPSTATSGRDAERALDRELDQVWDLIHRDRLDDAARQLAALRQRGENSAHYWFTCGAIHLRQHENDLAAGEFETSLRLNPKHIETYINLGLVYTRQKKLREAASTYELGAKLAPNDAVAFSGAARAYVQLKEPARAVPLFKRAIELEPGNPKYHRGLGGAYLDLLQRPAAIECYQKAVQLAPNDAENHRALGVALLRDRQNALAVKSLQTAVGLKPDDAECYLFLGFAYYYAGDQRAAKESWQTADGFDKPNGLAGRTARGAMSVYAKGLEPQIPAWR